MSENLILFVIGQAMTGVAVYAAIRADLREALVRISIIEKRMDAIK